MIRVAIFMLTGMILFVGAIHSADPATDAEREAVARGTREFAWDLFGKLGGREGNLCFSPYSLSLALAMTSAGARGPTAEEMAKALHFPPHRDRVHPAFAALTREVQGRGKRPLDLDVANALWAQKGAEFRPELVALAKDSYQADLRHLDFAGDAGEACRTVNRWAEERTKGKIKDLLVPDDVRNARLVLTNAVYLKAKWSIEFDAKATKQEDFQVMAGKKTKVPMMHQTAHLLYFAGDGVQGLLLPYQGAELSLIVLLPKKADGLAELERGLKADKVTAWERKLTEHEVEVSLPKFHFDSRFQLKDELGMRLAFTPGQADFSGLDGRKEICLGKAIHQTHIDVNEKGTAAAAATAVIPFATSAPPGATPPRPPKAVFRADHPFIFLVQHNATGSILFLGRVATP